VIISKKNQLLFLELFSVGPAMNLRYLLSTNPTSRALPLTYSVAVLASMFELLHWRSLGRIINPNW
jgi:hypothetical protein